MYRIAAVAFWPVAAIATVVTAAAVPVMRKHARRVEEFSVSHPEMTPPEVVAALTEQDRDKNLERWFELYKGQTTKGGLFNIPIYWFRDTRGRARYTTCPQDRQMLMIAEFLFWCKTPPELFKVKVD